MEDYNDRLGALMAFDDIGLIISTYGVLAGFNFLVSPLGANTWIVCTFFVGIKILLMGIADVTGIGRKMWVGLLFVLLADGIIVLVNQMMAFGLSNLMLLVTTGVDFIVIILAHIIWSKSFKKELVEDDSRREWIRDEAERPLEKTEIPDTSKAFTQPIKADEATLDELFKSDSPQVLVYGEEEVAQANRDRAQASSEESKDTLFAEEDDTDYLFRELANSAGGEELFSFDSITSPLPEITDDMLEASAKQRTAATQVSAEQSPQSGTAYAQTGAPAVQQAPAEAAPSFYDEPEPEPSDGLSFLDFDSITSELPVIDDNVLEAAAQQTNEAVQVSEPVQAPEAVQVSKSVPETEQATEPVIIPETVQPEAVQAPEVSVTAQPTEPVVNEAPQVSVIPTAAAAAVAAAVAETPRQTKARETAELFKEVQAEPEVLDYHSITGYIPKTPDSFVPVEQITTQNEIDTERGLIQNETKMLNRELDAVVDRIRSSEEESKQFEQSVDHLSSEVTNLPPIVLDDDITKSGRVIREKLRNIIDKQFVMKDVLNDLIETSDRLNRRILALDRIENQLKARERAVREQEQKTTGESLPELSADALFEQITQPIPVVPESAIRSRFNADTYRTEEVAHTEAEPVKEEPEWVIPQPRTHASQTQRFVQEMEGQTQTKLSGGEVHLQSESLDIIIDEADLEAVKAYLRQNPEA